jgi:hypothetical protein
MLGKYKHHGHSEGDIFVVTDMEDIQKHYSDNMMPMKLRVLGERIYGTRPFPSVIVGYPSTSRSAKAGVTQRQACHIDFA